MTGIVTTSNRSAAAPASGMRHIQTLAGLLIPLAIAVLLTLMLLASQARPASETRTGSDSELGDPALTQPTEPPYYPGRPF